MEYRRRSNKKQQKLLLERLHSNIKLARGNTLDLTVVKFWVKLSEELNKLGCRRNVLEWQKIWAIWVSKVKIKARKIRNHIKATGERPDGISLSAQDSKVLEIVFGSAPVYGFNSLEMGLPVTEEPNVTPPSSPENDPLSEPLDPPSPATNLLRPRRTVMRPSRNTLHDNLVKALNDNNLLMRESVRLAGSTIAEAIKDSAAATVQAAEIIASALKTINMVGLKFPDNN